MRKSKFTALALGIVLGTMAFSGCSDTEEKDLEYVDVGDLAAVSNPEIPPIVFNGSGSEASDHTSQNAGASGTESNIGGNASSPESGTSSSGEALPGNNSSPKTEIEIPESSDYYSAVAEPMKFDAEKAKNIFFGNADVTDDTQFIPEREPIYRWTNGDKELGFSNDEAFLEYTSDPAISINIIFGPPVQNNEGNAHLFEHRNDDLDFCTREEAVKTVSDTLSELGISVYNKPVVYSLCQSDMQAVVDAECAKGEFYQFDDDWQRVPVSSYTVQKNQECYYIVFNAGWNGIPIYNGDLYYMAIKDLFIPQPKITAIYSADGLIELRVSQYHSIVKQGEKISQLISPEAAAQVIVEKYIDVVGMEKISFDEMSLMYVLTPYIENGKINSSKVTMTPAWICTVNTTEYKYDRKTGKEGLVTEKETVFIDAQTGVEII